VTSQEVAQALGLSLVRGNATVRGSRGKRGLATALALAVGVGLLGTAASAAPALAAPPAAQAATVTQASGMLNTVLPQRLLDTRTTTGGHHAKLGSGATMKLLVVGAGGVPGAVYLDDADRGAAFAGRFG